MAATRPTLVAIVTLAATALQAKGPPADAAARAQQLVAATKAGQEREVGCGGLDADVAKALQDLGDRVSRESYERAAIAFRLAERAARCVGSDDLIGSAVNSVSEVLFGLAQYDASLAAAQEARQLYERVHDDAGLARSWNNVGNAHWWIGDTPAAFGDFERALALWTAAGDVNGQARALNNIGNIHKSLGEFDRAIDNYTRALNALQALGDVRRAAVVTNNISLVHKNRGDYATALEFNRRAIDMNRLSGDRARLAASLDAQGDINRLLGDFPSALRVFQQALETRISVGDRAGIMETTHNIGLVHFSQGDYELAIDAFKRGLRLNHDWSMRDDSFVAEALRNIGAAAWRLGQRARAEANCREALTIAEHGRYSVQEADLLNDLGQITLAQQRPDAAARLFERALEIRRRNGSQAGIAEALTSLASARLQQRQYGAALDLAKQAADIAEPHDYEEPLWRARTVAGMANRRVSRPAEARRALTDAIASIEHLSSQVAGGENLRQRFFEDKLSPYHELISLLIGEHAFDDALVLAERSKARVLAQLLRGGHQDDSVVLSQTERRERTRRRDALVALNRQIESEQAQKTPSEPRINSLEASRLAAREDVAAWDASLAARHPQFAHLRGTVAPLTVAEAARIVPNRSSAVLEYAVADHQLFVFALTSDGERAAVEAHAIDLDAAELAKRSERFRERVAARDFGVAEDARALYRLLIAPVAERIAGKAALIIVPDGPLWNVPFQALIDSKGYLIESAAISYAPSITALREIQRLPRPPAPRTVLAIAKSTFGAASAALPEAEAQVRAIRDIYGADRSLAVTGPDATERRFLSDAPKYAVLHLATHGALDEGSPMYSYLALSPAANDEGDDGRLEAWEIMRLKLAADLVVLAACDTGRGRIAPGEGVIGTMWAWFAAGARSMVVSQYAVESSSATSLLVAFHRQLATDRVSKAAALRDAALGLLHTPRYAHPYYWAGFVLVGDAD